MKASGILEIQEDLSGCVDLAYAWVDENGRVIRIDGGSESGKMVSRAAKGTSVRCYLEEALDGVDGHNEEER